MQSDVDKGLALGTGTLNAHSDTRSMMLMKRRGLAVLPVSSHPVSRDPDTNAVDRRLAPEAWRRARKGKIERRQVWSSRVRSPQRPDGIGCSSGQGQQCGQNGPSTVFVPRKSFGEERLANRMHPSRQCLTTGALDYRAYLPRHKLVVAQSLNL